MTGADITRPAALDPGSPGRGPVMGYCFTCGATADDLDATAMCAACRAAWRPAGDRPGDLGIVRPSD